MNIFGTVLCIHAGSFTSPHRWLSCVTMKKEATQRLFFERPVLSDIAVGHATAVFTDLVMGGQQPIHFDVV